MEVATDRTLEVYETLAALDDRERGEVLTWIADYVESKAKAEPIRGLYLVPPHGELIANGEKTSIAKSRRFDIEGDWILVSGKLAYGTMTLGEPSEIGLEEFDEQFNEHRVEKAERRRWWPDKKTLWLYAIESFKPYPEPRKVEVPSGVQTTMDRVEFEGQKQVESALKVRIAQTQAEAEKGFSARDDIALDEGLILPLRCDQGLWMRDTRVPLKAAFLDGDYKVLEVIDLKPLSEDVRMPPQGTAYALEARPSWFEMVGLEAGDVVVPQRAKAVGTRADILLEKLNDLPEKFVWIPDFVSLTGSQVYAKNREPNDTDIVLRAQDLDDRFYVVDKEADLQVPVDGSFALKLERLLIDKLGTKRVQYTNNAYGPGWSSAPLYDLCLVKREPLTLVDIGRREPAFAAMEYKELDVDSLGLDDTCFLSESEKAIYLTEFNRDGKRWVGPDIDADSFDEAEEKARDALEVMGELAVAIELKDKARTLSRSALDRMLRGASAEIKKQAKATYDENSVKPGRMVLSLKPLRPAPAGERQTIDVFYSYIEEYLDFPLYVSAKRDGATIYAHGDGKRVWLFSDDGEDRTEQLPTIAAALKKNFKSKSFVMGCEIEKWVDGKHYPREAAIGDVKKGEDEDLACNIFRLIYYDGEDLHEKPFSEVWKAMQKLPVDSKSDGALHPRKDGPINLVPHYEVNSLSALKSKVESTAYKPGVEGVVVKRADGDFPLRGEPDTSNPQEIKWHKSVAVQVTALTSVETKTPGVYNTWYGIPIE